MLLNDVIADSLEEAADLIDLQGWFRMNKEGKMERFPTDAAHPQKCHCFVTALPTKHYADAAEAFASWLGWRRGMSITELDFLITWNDSQDSAASVTGAMRDFVHELREKV